jgi:hypothetical protein
MHSSEFTEPASTINNALTIDANLYKTAFKYRPINHLSNQTEEQLYRISLWLLEVHATEKHAGSSSTKHKTEVDHALSQSTLMKL